MTPRTYRLGPGKFSQSARDSEWTQWVQEHGRIGAWSSVIEDSEHWWSNALYDLYEVPHDLTSAPLLDDFFLPEDASAIMSAYAEAIRSGTPWSIEAPFTTAKGKLLFVRSIGIARRLSSGKTMLFGTMQDVTELLRIRNDAHANVRFVESILDHLPHMVFVKEAKDLRFVRFNKAGERLLGIASNKMLGRNDHDFFPKEQADFFVAKDRATMASGMILDIPEEPIDTPNGRRILHTKKITIGDAQNRPAFLLGISEDITERKAKEETIEKQQVALAQSSRLSALGHMAGGIAHEINNPLAIIRGSAEIMVELMARPDVARQRLTELCTTICKTVDRISDIINGLRDFSRDGRAAAVERVPVRDLVSQSLSLCNEKLRLAGITVCAEAVPAHLAVMTQRVRASQVLVNLISNAFDALADSTQSEKRLSFSCEADDNGRALIVVADNGPGIPDAIADSIMQPFFTTKPVGKGTGLGLSISKGVCESMGGSLELRNPGERGATFVVSLPLAS